MKVTGSKRRKIAVTDEMLREKMKRMEKRQQEKRTKILQSLTLPEGLYYISVLREIGKQGQNPARIPHMRATKYNNSDRESLIKSCGEKEVFVTLTGKETEKEWAYYYGTENKHTPHEVLSFLGKKFGYQKVRNGMSNFPCLSPEDFAMPSKSQKSQSYDPHKNLTQEEKTFLALCQVFTEHEGRMTYLNICFYLGWEEHVDFQGDRTFSENLQKFHNLSSKLRDLGILDFEKDNVKSGGGPCPSLTHMEVKAPFQNPNQHIPLKDPVVYKKVHNLRHLCVVAYLKHLHENSPRDCYGNIYSPQESFENELLLGMKILASKYNISMQELRDICGVVVGRQDTQVRRGLSQYGVMFSTHDKWMKRKRRTIIMADRMEGFDLDFLFQKLRSGDKKGLQAFGSSGHVYVNTENDQDSLENPDPLDTTVSEDPDQTVDPVQEEPLTYHFPENEVEESIVKTFLYVKNRDGVKTQGKLLARPLIEQVDKMTPWSLTKQEIENILIKRSILEYGPATLISD